MAYATTPRAPHVAGSSRWRSLSADEVERKVELQGSQSNLRRTDRGLSRKEVPQERDRALSERSPSARHTTHGLSLQSTAASSTPPRTRGQSRTDRSTSRDHYENGGFKGAGSISGSIARERSLPGDMRRHREPPFQLQAAGLPRAVSGSDASDAARSTETASSRAERHVPPSPSWGHLPATPRTGPPPPSQRMASRGDVVGPRPPSSTSSTPQSVHAIPAAGGTDSSFSSVDVDNRAVSWDASTRKSLPTRPGPSHLSVASQRHSMPSVPSRSQLQSKSLPAMPRSRDVSPLPDDLVPDDRRYPLLGPAGTAGKLSGLKLPPNLALPQDGNSAFIESSDEEDSEDKSPSLEELAEGLHVCKVAPPPAVEDFRATTPPQQDDMLLPPALDARAASASASGTRSGSGLSNTDPPPHGLNIDAVQPDTPEERDLQAQAEDAAASKVQAAFRRFRGRSRDGTRSTGREAQAIAAEIRYDEEYDVEGEEPEDGKAAEDIHILVDEGSESEGDSSSGYPARALNLSLHSATVSTGQSIQNLSLLGALADGQARMVRRDMDFDEELGAAARPRELDRAPAPQVMGNAALVDEASPRGQHDFVPTTIDEVDGLMFQDLPNVTHVHGGQHSTTHSGGFTQPRGLSQRLQQVTRKAVSELPVW
eukprot:CAMPEP_0178393028 /NCGR_PEP_ID=MMETSP0689_2-20121128/11978_1 /TAXON_ID=160604 /ORGANISM="Amphidinium massartii, Strain CS-259" /LENGTH=653 /DNA_ID=CAMNT_0020013611 /DNA_START=31 /DNA_END=1989 /DNA_ORIENTATION=-